MDLGPFRVGAGFLHPEVNPKVAVVSVERYNVNDAEMFDHVRTERRDGWRPDEIDEFLCEDRAVARPRLL